MERTVRWHRVCRLSRAELGQRLSWFAALSIVFIVLLYPPPTHANEQLCALLQLECLELCSAENTACIQACNAGADRCWNHFVVKGGRAIEWCDGLEKSPEHPSLKDAPIEHKTTNPLAPVLAQPF